MKIISSELVRSLLPPRRCDAHKGDFGKVLITGGCTGMTGAVVLCAGSAIRTGSGLVTAAVPASLNTIFEIKLTEVMTLPIDDKNGAFIKSGAARAAEFASKCDCAAIGPGMGTSDGAYAFFEELIKSTSLPLVIDADGLNLLSKSAHLWEYIKGRAILTPHTVEMSRLTGYTPEEINADRQGIAEELAAKTETIVVLKGKNTIVTDGKATYMCDIGNPGMATGGSGDCLTGIILSLAGQKNSLLSSATAGVYIHALAGDIARDLVGEYSLIAGDIINCIPDAILKITSAKEPVL